MIIRLLFILLFSVQVALASGVTTDVQMHTEEVIVLSNPSNQPKEIKRLKVFPNPTTEYFKLSENLTVEEIWLYSLAGKRIKTFGYKDDKKYYVDDLERGIYLLRVVDKSERVLKTLRLIVK